MESTPDPRLFMDIDDILNGEQEKIKAESMAAGVASMVSLFALTERQAAIALVFMNTLVEEQANCNGLPSTDYLARLSLAQKTALMGYSAGTINGSDLANKLDPATGEPRAA